jgi:protein-tyrosine phosphatase
VRERRLVWDGCLNIRDLGGHPTEDGCSTRWGSVIRADSVRALTDSGWDALVAHGVRTIVDLRSHGELAADPPRDAPVDVVHVSVLPEQHDPVWAELDLAADDVALEKQRFYVEALRRWGDRFAEAIATVAHAPDAPVVVHCQVGKDRTGLVAALLLRLAGVPAGNVAADYALSAENLAPQSRPWVDEAADEVERERRSRLVATPAASMLGVLAAIESEHGSAAGFLRAHGLSTETVARARARLRP